MMNAPKTAQEIFWACLDVADLSQRSTRLADLCAEDDALRKHVEELLKAADIDDQFLEMPFAQSAMGPTDVPAANDDTSTATQLTGRAIGDFQILREIGRGGMGVVYEAEQISLGRHVALKVLPLASILDKTQLIRFKNEAKAAASLDHPNAVQVYSVGSERGVHYYAMQLVDGQTLADVILHQRAELGVKEAKSGPADVPSDAGRASQSAAACSSGDELTQAFTASSDERAEKDTVPIGRVEDTLRTRSDMKKRWRDAVDLIIQASAALEHAHRMGIVHRDVKPSNLMVDADGHLFITDFGLAMVEAEGNLTTSGSMLGTLRYMSPEQMRGDRHVLDHRTDIYSLGLTLYELLALQPAFTDSEPSRLMNSITGQDPPPLRRVNPSLPRDLETIVLKATAKEPGARYDTAQQFASDLRRFLDNQPIQAKPPTAWEKGAKWTRRHKPVVTAVASTLLVVTVVAAALLWGERSKTLAAYGRETQQRGVAEARAEEASRNAATARAAQRKEAQALREVSRQKSVVTVERNTAVQNLYYADMRLGFQDWRSGNLGRLREMLESHHPQPGHDDLRGWEWYFLLSLYHNDVRTLYKHSGLVSAAAWSPDGTRLASVSLDGDLRIWDGTSGNALVTIPGQSYAWGVAWDASGQHVAWGSSDQMVRILDIESGEVQELEGNVGSLRSIAWHPNGKWLAWGGHGNGVCIWDTASNKRVRMLRAYTGAWQSRERVHCLAWHPDGSQLAVLRPKGLLVWSTETWEIVGDCPATDGDLNHNSMAWDATGKRLAWGGASGDVVVWDATRREVVQRIAPLGGIVLSVTWSPDGSYLVTGTTDNMIRLWNATDGVLVHTFRGHQGPVSVVDWSPDGKQLLSGSADETLKIWNTSNPVASERFRWQETNIQSVSWGPAGNQLAYVDAGEDNVVIQTIRGHRKLLQKSKENSRFGLVRWSPGGQWVAASCIGEPSPSISIIDVNSVKETGSFQSRLNEVLAMEWATGTSRIALLGTDDDGTIRVEVWDAVKRELISSFAPRIKGRVDFNFAVLRFPMSWAPDGKQLAIGASGGATVGWTGVRVFDVQTGDNVKILEYDRSYGSSVLTTDWSPDGHWLIAASSDGTISMWDASTGEPTLHKLRGHATPITTIAWSPDNRRFATGGEQALKIWDAQSGEELLEIDDHATSIHRVLWSPDGQRIAVECEDGDVVVWDARHGHAFALSQSYKRERKQIHKKMARRQYRRIGAAIEAKQWDLAAEETGCALQMVPTDMTLWNTSALLLLKLGKQEEYRRLCSELLESADGLLEPEDVEIVCWTCCLLPAVAPDDVLLRIAETTINNGPEDEQHLNLRGAILYRTGRVEDAVKTLQTLSNTWHERRLPRCVTPAYAWYWLAMSHYRLGQTTVANHWFENAKTWHDLEAAGGLSWSRELILDHLQAEASELLSSVTLRGDTQLSNQVDARSAKSLESAIQLMYTFRQTVEEKNETN